MEEVNFTSPHFVSIPLTDGLLSDLSGDIYPTQVYAWGHPRQHIEFEGNGTHFGFVTQGEATLVYGENRRFALASGMYFCLPEDGWIENGAGIIITRLEYEGMFTIGGPIEKKGRLRYIDGCSDTLLIPPVKKGDACLNFLHFPENITQTRHTHPSVRIGIVARGNGRCIVPENYDGTGPDVAINLMPGNAFVIPPNGHHSFLTDDGIMDVIAYHPDSDTGPEDDNHPMINRTIINGVSAANLDNIRTQDIRK
jgi:hypothetical protein